MRESKKERMYEYGTSKPKVNKNKKVKRNRK